MNERIEKLALQAKEYADTKYSKLVSASRWGDCVPGIRELYTEKLAELIVQECTDVGSQWADGLIDPKHYTFVNKKIKEHFGVKE